MDAGSIKIPDGSLDPMPETKRFLNQLASKDYQRLLRYHRGEFWGHDGRRYRVLSEDEMHNRLVKYLDQSFSHLTKGVIANVLACLRAETQLGSIIEPPCWLTTKRTGRNYISLQNGILDVDGFLAGATDVLLPHTPL